MRRAASAISGAAVLALAVGGCAGDGAVAPLPGPPAPTGTPEPSADAGADVPALALPADVSLVVEPPAAVPDGAAAAVRDWQLGQRAFVAAAARADPRFGPLGRYQAQDALLASVRTLRLKRERNRTVVGVRRIYAVAVGPVGADRAAMSWCVDDSRFFSRDRATGRAVVRHGPSDYYRFDGSLVRDARLGGWVLVRATGQEGVQC
jgi:hypothetical protein